MRECQGLEAFFDESPGVGEVLEPDVGEVEAREHERKRRVRDEERQWRRDVVQQRLG